MSESKYQKEPSHLKFEARNNIKILRRDGTVEEIPGEWEATTEEEALQRFGVYEDFRQWFKNLRGE